MPPQGTEGRADQRATLVRLSHELLVSDELGRLLEELRPREEALAYDSDEASVIRVARRDHEKARRVPAELRRPSVATRWSRLAGGRGGTRHRGTLGRPHAWSWPGGALAGKPGSSHVRRPGGAVMRIALFETSRGPSLESTSFNRERHTHDTVRRRASVSERCSLAVGRNGAVFALRD